MSLIQCQVPTAFGEDVTVICCSNAARLLTGMSKVTMTGMPTPTVSFWSGVTLG